MTRLLTIDQVADRMAVSTSTVRLLLEQLGAVDLNNGKSEKRLIRIPEAGLDSYLRACAIGKAEEPRRTAGIRIERRKA